MMPPAVRVAARVSSSESAPRSHSPYSLLIRFVFISYSIFTSYWLVTSSWLFISYWLVTSYTLFTSNSFFTSYMFLTSYLLFISYFLVTSYLRVTSTSLFTSYLLCTSYLLRCAEHRPIAFNNPVQGSARAEYELSTVMRIACLGLCTVTTEKWHWLYVRLRIHGHNRAGQQSTGP